MVNQLTVLFLVEKKKKEAKECSFMYFAWLKYGRERLKLETWFNTSLFPDY